MGAPTLVALCQSKICKSIDKDVHKREQFGEREKERYIFYPEECTSITVLAQMDVTDC